MRLFRISERDNAGVMLEGTQTGHKAALADIRKGQKIIKYGYPIGSATQAVKSGEWIHTHNLKTGLGGVLEYTYSPDSLGTEAGTAGRPPESGSWASVPTEPGGRVIVSTKADDRTETFTGYLREDGRAGIRNEIWIIPTVGCIAQTAEKIAAASNVFIKDGCDGIFAFPHPFGCSQLGDDALHTQRILAGLITHPNAAGVLVLGLGCENNQIRDMKKVIGTHDPERVRFLECQSAADEIKEGIQIVRSLIEKTKDDRRTLLPLSKLVVGVKCGGSDGLSGITANPLVGAFTDRLVRSGGTAVLTEVPEMFGAESILMNRCADKAIFDKTVALINDFKKYYETNNQPVYENPSPGNKAGGITTLEEKSLGCIQKSGSTPVMDVLNYGERVIRTGLNLLSAPGNDLVSTTALAAAGAQIILFTTGRGTPFGAPVPTFKISSNTPLAHKKPQWIDFDAGVLIEENGIKIDALAEVLYKAVKQSADGAARTKNEIHDYRGIALFKTGVML